MIKDYNEVYETEKYLWGNKPSISANFFANYLLNESIKDVHLVAAGYGRNIKPFITNKINVIASDISRSGINLIDVNYPEIEKYELDIINPQQLIKTDAIYSFSLLHLFGEESIRLSIVKNLVEMLNNNGLLFLVNMDIGNSFRDKDKKINIITRDEVFKYCNEFNLELILEKSFTDILNYTDGSKTYYCKGFLLKKRGKYMKPKHLEYGNKIAIVSLSSGIVGEEFVNHQRELGIKRLDDLGLEPVFMNNALKGIKTLKENPKLRADDLKQAFSDNSIKAVLCSIGGDDTYLTLKYLLSDTEFINNVKNNPKIFLGFSDSTVNHLMFYKLGLNTFYGQAFMTEFGELDIEMLDYSLEKFNYLFGNYDKFKINSSNVWYKERTDFSINYLNTKRKQYDETRGYELLSGNGKVYGKLLGGCVESLYHLINVEECSLDNEYNVFPVASEWDNKIVFLETAEVEAGTTPELYRMMIRKFKDFGMFNNINGLIIGKPQNELYYDEFKQIIIDELSGFNHVIFYNVNFGHALPRAILPINIEVSLNSSNMLITIEEEVFN